MATIYDEIYKRAEPYWQTRQNHIHMPIVYNFVRQLLTLYPAADEDVVLPAALLHDVGWMAVPQEQQLNAFGPQAKDEAAKRLHETAGVKIAAKILASLNYDLNKTQEILTIIDGHDSRSEAISLNDQLVKDADRLWRFTPIAIEIDYRRFGTSLEAHLDWLEAELDHWLFTPEAKIMSRKALVKARSRAQTEGLDTAEDSP